MIILFAYSLTLIDKDQILKQVIDNWEEKVKVKEFLLKREFGKIFCQIDLKKSCKVI